MKSKIIFSILAIFIALVACLMTWSIFILKPIGGDKVVAIEIAPNTSYRQIGQNLQDKGIVRSHLAFDIYVLATGQYSKLKAGRYLLNVSDSTQNIAAILAGGRVANYQLTIPEGLTIKETDQYLVDHYSVYGFGLGQFTNLVANTNYPTDLLNNFPNIKDNGGEGLYLGDTFDFANQITEISLAQKMLDNFSVKVLPSFSQSLPAPLTSKYEALILASIVEKEAITQKDRQIVAGIFLKRLSEGQFLQSDATVAYGLGQTTKKVLDAVDIASDTPYNTYLYKGLPKAPITNPSLISIEAVFQPTLTDYNYFLSDKSGNLHFAVTYEEHLQNRAKYIGE